MKISSSDSNTCLFAPYYKQNKGYVLGFLFKQLDGLRPPRGLNEKVSEKHLLFITYSKWSAAFKDIILSLAPIQVGLLSVTD